MAERHDEFDTRIAIITPENIEFDYRIAGPFQRLPAFLLDFLIRCIAWLLLFLLFSLVFGFSVGIGWGLILFFGLDIFYGGFFETVWNGQTPGKRVLNLRVVTISGEPINASQAVLRNILRIADGLPFIELGALTIPLYQVGIFSMMVNRRYQRLGDLVCGTIVVAEEQEGIYGVMRVMEPEAIRLAAEIPASFEVTRSLGIALSSYVQRRVMFGWARREEISRHLAEPLRQRFGLNYIPSYDLLLCALYHKAFVEERPSPGGVPVLPQSVGPPAGWPGAGPNPWAQQPGGYAYPGYPGPPAGRPY